MSYKIKWNGKYTKDQVSLALMKGLSATMTNLLGTTMKNCPIKTGKLVSSLSKTFQYRDELDMSGAVFTTTKYAPFVEFGTRYQKAQHFMNKSLMEEISDLEKRFKNII